MMVTLLLGTVMASFGKRELDALLVFADLKYMLSIVVSLLLLLVSLVDYTSRISMARTPLGPWKSLRTMDSSSH